MMMTDRYVPEPEFRQKLDAAVPSVNDFVLFCARCWWVGTTNGVHAHSSTCPECRNHGVRIWRNR